MPKRQVISSYTMDISELTFQAETLMVCPKQGFGHTDKVSAWNSWSEISAKHKFWENILESWQNINETNCWHLNFPGASFTNMI